jgi:hypothetical protein
LDSSSGLNGIKHGPINICWMTHCSSKCSFIWFQITLESVYKP